MICPNPNCLLETPAFPCVNCGHNPNASQPPATPPHGICAKCGGPTPSYPCVNCAYRPAAGSATQTPALNIMLLNRYRLEKILAVGGMGRVYKGTDTLFGRPCAIKEILPSSDPEEQKHALKMFEQEAALLAGLHHTHIVTLLDFFVERGNAYLVMELCSGGDLSGIRMPISEIEALNLSVQIASALSKLHQNSIVYKDMKPANVLLRDNGQAVLADFGISRVFNPTKARDTQRFVSKGYAPPEQYAESIQTQPSADIYAFGATLYHLLTGTAPETWIREVFVEFPRLRKLRPDLRDDFIAVIEKCVQNKMSDRFQSGSELLDALMPLKRRWEAALCKCGHQNLPDSLKCTRCGSSLLKPTAFEAHFPHRLNLSLQKMPQKIWEITLGKTRGMPVLHDGLIQVVTEQGQWVTVDLQGQVVQSRYVPPSKSTPVVTVRGPVLGTEQGLLLPEGRVLEHHVFFAPPLAGQEIYALSYAGVLFKLNLEGQILWQSSLGGQGIGTPVLAGSRVLVTLREGRVISVDAITGAWQWNTQLSHPIFGMPVVLGDQVYVLDHLGNLNLLHLHSGARRSSLPIVGKNYNMPHQTAAGWAFADHSGQVVMMDAGLNLRWTRHLNATVVAAPVVAGGLVLVADEKGQVDGLDVASGQTRFVLQHQERIIVPPICDGNTLITLTQGGILSCFVG
ncbi:protein kinase domain-containing protein [Deinococcus cellulosilyticus]|uniref:Protein kinase n=1 Tax=Deinococcus cellulosilyticus (strain DSM 18568 / NBRC 106333 / KACC 11606 / 5516J-15) TaxID=1223518 RepID=A0A511N277_DEIC1|nr:serine/threonine-protein kinase [Deinococcus cellulosilyticus]GEM46965.1 protein kinase [Deinococcus cellulosilyticus NBRC 106333 = KACC 11606]